MFSQVMFLYVNRVFELLEADVLGFFLYYVLKFAECIFSDELCKAGELFLEIVRGGHLVNLELYTIHLIH